MKKVHVKTGDEVIVISGNDKDARGKVIEVSPKEGKVIVEGINIVSKHVKPRKQGDAGGIMQVPAPLYASKVLLYCSKCEAGRRAKKVIKDGKKTRVCAKCGAKI
ncbi:MAG: 50S ribosomal protein L24 [Clostridiales bacterium]|nr:50S ribosomal protein L24 [Clostridiales bacterium]